LAYWITKEDLAMCCLQETLCIDRNKHWLKVKEWKKIYQANGPHKQAGIAILISHKVDFILKLVRRDKEGHFILLKGAIYQEKITIVNLYVPNVGAPNVIKHILLDLKTQTDPKTVVVRLQYTSITNRYIIQTKKIKKETLELWTWQMSTDISHRTIYNLPCSPRNFL
jgi:exonuclease III